MKYPGGIVPDNKGRPTWLGFQSSESAVIINQCTKCPNNSSYEKMVSFSKKEKKKHETSGQNNH